MRPINSLTIHLGTRYPCLMWASADPLTVSVEQQDVLERWARSHNQPVSVQRRAKVILLAAQGASNNSIAKEVGVSRPSVISWRRRFVLGGTDALSKTKPGRGRKPSIPIATVTAIVEATLHSSPTVQARWSCRTMAKEFGVSPDTVHRIWDAHGLQPHRVETFKLSQKQAVSRRSLPTSPGCI